MISPLSHEPQAQYDDDGNIVIRVKTTSALPEEQKTKPESLKVSGEIPLIMAQPSSSEEVTWDTVEEPVAAAVQEERMDVRHRFEAVSVTLLSAANEGASQVHHTVAESSEAIRHAATGVGTGMKRFWAFLLEPVSVAGKKNNREASRSALFLFDVLRFGGTFAGIFVVLFTALNAQSFWQIAASNIMPLIEPPSLELPESASPVVRAPQSSDLQGLLTYLPDVGPPTDMVIIPKLKVAAPLVQPPTEALLKQDWKQVEADIQQSLTNGVVHYPGTAKPGQAGNFFLTGHSSNYQWVHSAYNSIFARLHQLNVGDEYWVYWNGDKHRYVVRSKKEVSPNDISVLDQPPDERIATLMTCTPVGTTLRRLIVQAQEVDPDTLEPMKVGEKTERAPAPYAAQMLPI